MKRRLPIGIQDFIGIRQDGFVYVDKTARIYDLLTGSDKAYFLSRPRRFDKSLTGATHDAARKEHEGRTQAQRRNARKFQPVIARSDSDEAIQKITCGNFFIKNGGAARASRTLKKLPCSRVAITPKRIIHRVLAIPSLRAKRTTVFWQLRRRGGKK